ncbi:MAG: hypothetical protein QF793_02650 [Candidatus Peribacteraceae bacterium]|nr:hypothetical protein [Candidatus Peribacteraceae bacterium]|tara:strand:- start:975 stop:1775 length:801 start_codon:yes stop_codon:yes gene_type:complete
MHKYIAIVAGIVAAAALPDLAAAQNINPCPLGNLACPGGSTDVFIANILVRGGKFAFGGVLFAMLVWYGFKLIMGADNDSTISEVYNAYAYAMIGTILAGGAFTLANTFAVPGNIVNQAPTNTILFGVITALRTILFTALLFNMFFQGYRLISSQDESQVEKSKKQFIYGMVGAGIVILADRLVFAFSGVQVGILSTEAIGIANFIGTILGAFAVIALFVAGLWLVFAVNEQNSEKAKKIIITTFVVLAICMVSLALIRLTFRAPF